MKPAKVSSKNVDDQLKTAVESGDNDIAAAMHAFKTITEKYPDGPPEGSEDFYIWVEAWKQLKDKGFSTQQGKKNGPAPFAHGYPGM